MFPIYPLGSNSGFTYDNLSETRPGRIRTALATLAMAGAVAVVVLASGGRPIQADAPGEAAISASIDDGDDGAVVDHVVRAEP